MTTVERPAEKIDPAEPGFRYTRKVFFYETDLAGVVHFSCYFRYMEEAEHALWRAAGLTVDRAGADSAIRECRRPSTTRTRSSSKTS